MGQKFEVWGSLEGEKF